MIPLQQTEQGEEPVNVQKDEQQTEEVSAEPPPETLVYSDYSVVAYLGKITMLFYVETLLSNETNEILYLSMRIFIRSIFVLSYRYKCFFTICLLCNLTVPRGSVLTNRVHVPNLTPPTGSVLTNRVPVLSARSVAAAARIDGAIDSIVSSRITTRIAWYAIRYDTTTCLSNHPVRLVSPWSRVPRIYIPHYFHWSILTILLLDLFYR